MKTKNIPPCITSRERGKFYRADAQVVLNDLQKRICHLRYIEPTCLSRRNNNSLKRSSRFYISLSFHFIYFATKNSCCFDSIIRIIYAGAYNSRQIISNISSLLLRQIQLRVYMIKRLIEIFD